MSSQRYISDTLKQKKKKVRVIKAYVWFFVAALILGGFLYLMCIPQIQIRDVKINGNTFVTTQEIQDKANSQLHSFILGFIPRSNVFLFSKRELELKIKENPAVIDAVIKKDYLNGLSIQITEQEKEMIYCAAWEYSNCFYINTTGFIYAQVVDYIIPEQEIIIYSEQGEKKLQDIILEEELYVNVVSFIKSSARQDIRIGKVQIKSDGLIEFHTRDGARIITSQFDDFEKDFSNLIVLFEKNVLAKDQLSQIEYIDLRFGNKVFYKNKTY